MSNSEMAEATGLTTKKVYELMQKNHLRRYRNKDGRIVDSIKTNEYIRRKWYIETDYQMGLMLGLNEKQVHAIRKDLKLVKQNHGQKNSVCWNCKNSVDATKCEWVKSCLSTPKIPEYAKGQRADVEGNVGYLITKCERFEKG